MMKRATTTILSLTTLLWACGERPCEDTLTCEVGGDGGAGAMAGPGGSGGTATGTGTTTGMPGGGGSGGGTKGLGETCAAGGECTSGFCAEDVCCDAACDGGCESCGIAGSEGTCTPFDAGVNPGDLCGPTSSCNGNGSCSGAHIWSRSFGGPGDDDIVGVAWVGDGYVVAGNFDQSIDFGSGPLTGTDDIFVAKLDEMGNEVWSKRFGDAELDRVEGLAVAGDGSIVLTGYFFGALNLGATPLSTTARAAFLAKLSSSGDELWAMKATTTATAPFNVSQGKDVAIDPGQGDIVMVGSYMKTVSLGGPTLVDYATVSGAMFVARFTTTGQHLWSKGFGSDGGGVSYMAVDLQPSGPLTVATTYYGTLNFGGSNLNSASGGDTAVASLTAGGDHVWSRRNAFSHVRGVSVSATGATTITGGVYDLSNFGGGTFTPNGQDAYVARYDAAGGHLWSFIKGDSANQSGIAVTHSPFGLYVAGRVEGTVSAASGMLSSAGATDAFVLGMDAGGVDDWALLAGDAGAQEATVLAESASGIVVGGVFTSTMPFGPRTLTSNGAEDAFVAVVAP